MKFTRLPPDPGCKLSYAEVSECGEYRTCAIGRYETSNGPRTGWWFEAWHGRTRIAVRCEDAEAARKACREHKARQGGRRAA